MSHNPDSRNFTEVGTNPMLSAKENLLDFLFHYRGHFRHLAYNDYVEWKKITTHYSHILEFHDKLKKLIDDAEKERITE